MQSQLRVIGQLLFVVALGVGVAAASLDPVWGHLKAATDQLAQAGGGQEVRVVKIAAKHPKDAASLTPKLLQAAYGSGLARAYGLHLEVVAICDKANAEKKAGCQWEARAKLRNAGDGATLATAKTTLLPARKPLGKETAELSVGSSDIAPLHRIHNPRDTSEDDVIARLHQSAGEIAASVRGRNDLPAPAQAAIAGLATFAAPRNALLQQLEPALAKMRAKPTRVLASIINGEGEARFLTLQLLNVESGEVTAKADAAIGEVFPPTLPLFFGAAVLCLIGIVLWRRGIAQEIAALAEAAKAGGGDGDDDPFALLEQLVPAADAVRERAETLNEEALMAEVDVLLSKYVLPFAEVRTGVTDRLGMALGAEILVTVAYGERMLNRTWSAAADGHLPEARRSLPDAVDALDHARDLARAAQKP